VSARRGGRAGFTLIEVLAAFTIVALFAVLITRGLVGARYGAAAIEASGEAENVARSLMEGPIPAALALPGRKTGKTGRYAWTIRSELLGLTLPAPRSEDGPPPYRPMRIKVSVQVTPTRTLEVETIRLLRAPTS
jgi:prepilin-type N-terminal cleavage/methylation domain-containing protein